MKMNEDGKTVAAMDCLVPGIGEIIGGSQREDDFEKLENRIKELGMRADDYKYYMDLRKYGSTRHAGFGLGFERCVMYLTGVSNIRDIIRSQERLITVNYSIGLGAAASDLSAAALSGINGFWKNL